MVVYLERKSASICPQAVEPTKGALKAQQVSQLHTSGLAAQTDQMVGSKKIHMLYGVPGNELFVATLARVVTMVVKGTSINPNAQLKGSLEELDVASSDLDGLLAVRKQHI